MKLYFENSYGKRRLIGTPSDSDASWKLIKDFCDERDYKIPYIRYWTTSDGERYYDVGSHTEFFIEVNEDGDN